MQDLLKTIVRWKWLILLIFLGTLSAAITMMALKEEVFCAQTDIKLGRIAGDLVESPNEIQHYFKLIKDGLFLSCPEDSLQFSIEDGKLFLSYYSPDASKPEPCLSSILDPFLERHAAFYKAAHGKLEDNVNQALQAAVIPPRYLLPSYNYATHVITKPVLLEGRDTFFPRAIKLAIIAALALTFAILLALCLQGIAALRPDKRSDCGDRPDSTGPDA